MPATIEDILSSLCSEVTLSHANDFQKIYALNTPLEAKLAFEVLTVFGLDVKVYHQADKPSKLYISPPSFSEAQARTAYAGALAYARSLKQIKLGMETLCRDNEAALSAVDYNIAFLKGQGSAKQIVIQILPSEDARALAASATAPEASAPSAPAVPAVAARPRSSARRYGEKPKSHYEELSSGPTVGRGGYRGKLSAENEAQQRSLCRRMGLMLFGNMTTSSFATLVMAVIAGVVLSVFVILRGFVCPDLAVANKNRAWYCGSYGEIQQPQKQQQQPLAPR